MKAGPSTLGDSKSCTSGDMIIGRATYEPGWRWSQHVGPTQGRKQCPVEHVGLVLAGVATAAFDDGSVRELCAGHLFYIPPTPHDSWVIGEEPYISLHFLGAGHYAAPEGDATLTSPSSRSANGVRSNADVAAMTITYHW